MNRWRLALTVAVAFGTLPLAGCGSPAVDCDTYLDPTQSTVSPVDPPAFGYRSVDYFGEIAFGAEYGGGSQVIHRWTDDVKISIHGDPTDDDLATLCEVLREIDALVDTVDVSIVGSGQNVNLYFAPQSDFRNIDPDYVAGNLGFFNTRWDGTGSIYKATVLVATDVMTQAERNHIIREEVTQMLGLMRDSYTYPDSIFYQEWSEVQEYSDLDRDLIQILYLPAITPGMTPSEAAAAIPRP
jgi:hypothetical protein